MAKSKEKSVQEAIDIQEQNNLNRGYELIKENYLIATQRFKSADEKLNMILVFNAALITTLSFILPIEAKNCVLSTLSYTFLTLFIIAVLISIISIVIGIFPKAYEIPSFEIYTQPETYQKTEPEFQGSFIATYNITIKQLSEKSNKKLLCAKISLIALLSGLLFLITLFILSNI